MFSKRCSKIFVRKELFNFHKLTLELFHAKNKQNETVSSKNNNSILKKKVPLKKRTVLLENCEKRTVPFSKKELFL